MNRVRLAAVTGAVVALAACSPGEAVTNDEPLSVAAASDLRPAFDEVADQFENRTGQRVAVTYGSSGQLAQQLIEGAPMEVYAAADASYAERVLDAGRGDPASQTTYAFGRLAMWSTAQAWGEWERLEDLAADPSVDTVAIANPEHAPYGRAARQALRAAGVWDDLEPRVVFGEHVADAQRMAASGNADAAIVALSLARANRAEEEGRWTSLPPKLHQPLQQDLVVVTDEAERAELAEDFVQFVTSEEGQETMARYGFAPPDGDRS